MSLHQFFTDFSRNEITAWIRHYLWHLSDALVYRDQAKDSAALDSDVEAQTEVLIYWTDVQDHCTASVLYGCRHIERPMNCVYFKHILPASERVGPQVQTTLIAVLPASCSSIYSDIYSHRIIGRELGTVEPQWLKHPWDHGNLFGYG